MAQDKTHRPGLTRRGVLGSASGMAAAQFLTPRARAFSPSSDAAPNTSGNSSRIVLRVNGLAHPLTIDTRTTLLDVLRERLDLTDAKKGCDHGQCGACAVHVDGECVLSCLTLAVQAPMEPPNRRSVYF